MTVVSKSNYIYKFFWFVIYIKSIYIKFFQGIDGNRRFMLRGCWKFVGRVTKNGGQKLVGDGHPKWYLKVSQQIFK